MASEQPIYCRHGIWEEFYDTGAIKCRGMYECNRKCGTWHTFDENGNVTGTMNYTAGALDGPYDCDGESGIYQMGVRIGHWVSKRYERNYDNDGIMEGEQKVFYPDGTLGVWVRAEHGICRERKEYYPNGCIQRHTVFDAEGRKHELEIECFRRKKDEVFPERITEYKDGVARAVKKFRDIEGNDYTYAHVASDFGRHGYFEAHSDTFCYNPEFLDVTITGAYEKNRRTGQWSITSPIYGNVTGCFHNDQPNGTWVFNYRDRDEYTITFNNGQYVGGRESYEAWACNLVHRIMASESF